MPPKGRPNNRLLVLCTSINDVTAWPFWKFLQMKKIKGVTDMALLAFNSEGGSFEARIDGDKYTMKNFAKVKGYKQEMFQSFLERWYDPGRSYFVYGGHGMGDYLEFEQHKFALQAHELASLLDKRYFEAILFDACFMANLDCAYHLRHNTRYIGACEGYMWEPDTALDYHIFNTFTASAMSRFRDPRLILETIQKEYTNKAPRGDFSVIDTKYVAELRQFVSEHVMQRVYNHATLYNAQQQERLSLCAERALEDSINAFGQPGGESYLDGLLTHRHAVTVPSTPDTFALANLGRLRKKQRVAAAIQFEHALYPSETLDKHLVDLKSYLVDMALEEEALAKSSGGSAAYRRRPLRKAAAGAWSPSRAYHVEEHGSLPPAREISPNAAPPPPPPLTSSSLLSVATTAPAPLLSSSAASTGASATLPATTAGPSSSSDILSAYPPDSARYGLDLFNRVVVSHVQPRSAGIYAARLGGLSVAVHEFSAMSKPIEPWKVSRTILNKKIKSFLAKGSLEEVRMSRDPARAATPTNSPLVMTHVDGNTATTTAGGLTLAAATAEAANPSAATPVMVAAHLRSSLENSTQASVQAAATSSSSSLSSPAATRGVVLGSNVSAQPSPLMTTSASAYSHLSSGARFYASYSCSRRPAAAASASSSSSVASSLSMSSSLTSGNCFDSRDHSDACAEEVAPMRRSHSLSDLEEVRRMAAEAAMLLDPANRC